MHDLTRNFAVLDSEIRELVLTRFPPVLVSYDTWTKNKAPQGSTLSSKVQMLARCVLTLSLRVEYHRLFFTLGQCVVNRGPLMDLLKPKMFFQTMFVYVWSVLTTIEWRNANKRGSIVLNIYWPISQSGALKMHTALHWIINHCCIFFCFTDIFISRSYVF